MAKKVLTDLNLQQNELQNVVVQNLASAPSNPKAGQVYFNTTDSKYYVYNGSDWVDLTSQGHIYKEGNGIKIGEDFEVSVDTTVIQGAISDLETIRSNAQAGKGASDEIAQYGDIVSYDAEDFAPSTLNAVVEAIGNKISAEATTENKLIDKNYVDTELAKKEGNIEDLATIRANAQAGKGAADTIANYGDIVSHNASEFVTPQKTLAGYGIEDAYTKSEVEGLISSVYKFKGSVANYEALPTTGQKVGDVYNVEAANKTHGIKAGDNVAWDGSKWDVLSGVVDLSDYLTKTEIATELEKKQNVITDLATIKSNAQAGKGAADTIAEYGDIVSHNAEDFLSADTVLIKKVSAANEALTVSGGVCTWNIVHTFGADVVCTVKELSSGEEVCADVTYANNLITIKFNASENIQANTYKAIIIG